MINENTTQFKLIDSENLTTKLTKDNEKDQPSIIEHISSKVEEATEFVKYKGLKIKEYFGTLNQKEFEDLLFMDFKQELKDNPPINKVFSPEEEFTKLRTFPKNEQKEALETFKENLTKQRIAWATCRVFIERSIEFNNDVPEENLTGLVDVFSEQYGFTSDQKQIAETLIEHYYAKREQVLEVRKEYPNDLELIKRLTGVELPNQANVEISIGPMTIDIKVPANYANNLYKHTEGPMDALPYGGFASHTADEEQICFIVSNIDTNPKLLSPKGTRDHEYEHQKNKAFRYFFDQNEVRQPPQNKDFDQRFHAETDPVAQRALMDEALALIREASLEKIQEDALSDAKDEITAMATERNAKQIKIDANRMFFAQDSNPYDYLADERKRNVSDLANKILITEYKKVIESSIDAISELITKGGYTKQEAIALLMDKSLKEWPRTTKRLLEYTNK